MVMRVESTLRLENDSESQGNGWWTWSVWVAGDPDDLAGIEAVTYRLHPTFPNPVVKITDPSSNFKLSSLGWGEFAIAADVHMKDGRTIRLEKWLELAGAAGRETPGESRPSVFLSFSVADADLASALQESLDAQGIEVRSAAQLVERADGLAPTIDQQIEDADAVVAVVSDPASGFVEREALLAQQKGRFVLPVVLPGAQVRGGLSKIPRVELRDTRNITGLAQQIVARVKDRIVPDETV